MKNSKKGIIKQVIINHISNNKKEYIIISLMFIIGIFLGVFFVNNINENQANEVANYFSTSIESLKQTPNIEYGTVLKQSISRNLTFGITLWFLGTTIIGIPIVIGAIIYKGFCLGYTIATAVTVLGIAKGTSFILAALLLHNIVFIPIIIAIGVSGFKLYGAIIKDRKKNNVKIEIIRHTIFSLIMLVFLVLSSIIETYVTNKLILLIIKYL